MDIPSETEILGEGVLLRLADDDDKVDTELQEVVELVDAATEELEVDELDEVLAGTELDVELVAVLEEVEDGDEVLEDDELEDNNDVLEDEDELEDDELELDWVLVAVLEVELGAADEDEELDDEDVEVVVTEDVGLDVELDVVEHVASVVGPQE